MRTSAVPIIFSANLRISLMARGARFLNPLQAQQHISNGIHKHVSLNSLNVNYSDYAYHITNHPSRHRLNSCSNKSQKFTLGRPGLSWTKSSQIGKSNKNQTNSNGDNICTGFWPQLWHLSIPDKSSSGAKFLARFCQTKQISAAQADYLPLQKRK